MSIEAVVLSELEVGHYHCTSTLWPLLSLATAGSWNVMQLISEVVQDISTSPINRTHNSVKVHRKDEEVVFEH